MAASSTKGNAGSIPAGDNISFLCLKRKITEFMNNNYLFTYRFFYEKVFYKCRVYNKRITSLCYFQPLNLTVKARPDWSKTF